MATAAPTSRPRVELMVILGDIRRRTAALQSNTRDRARGTVYSAPDLAENETRRRRPEEYPEQDPAYWEQVHIVANYLEAYVGRLRQIAETEHARLTGGTN
jgi:hypothetical protein